MLKYSKFEYDSVKNVFFYIFNGNHLNCLKGFLLSQCVRIFLRSNLYTTYAAFFCHSVSDYSGILTSTQAAFFCGSVSDFSGILTSTQAAFFCRSVSTGFGLAVWLPNISSRELMISTEQEKHFKGIVSQDLYYKHFCFRRHPTFFCPVRLNKILFFRNFFTLMMLVLMITNLQIYNFLENSYFLYCYLTYFTLNCGYF